MLREVHATVIDMQKSQDVVEGDLLLSREVMDIARISRRTLERWVSSGKLPAIRIAGSDRRYRRTDLNDLLNPAVPSLPETDGPVAPRPASTVPPVDAGRHSSAA